MASLAAQLAFVVLWASLIWDASCTLNFGFVVLAIGVSAGLAANYIFSFSNLLVKMIE